MAAPRRFELDELLIRPGTYFNPETEMLLVVDDAATVDADLFEEAAGDEDDERDWVRIADEACVDETSRDDLIQRFETSHGSGATGAVPADLDDEDDLGPDLEPDEDQD